MLTALGIAMLAQHAGFAGEGLVNSVAVALAESGGEVGAISPTGDYGLWQVHLAAHPQYDAACALDAACNARAAYAISSGGTNWRPWATWTNGRAQARMAEARAAVAALGQGGASTPGALSFPQRQPLVGGLALLALLAALGWALG